jgi:hypothetical protein
MVTVTGLIKGAPTQEILYDIKASMLIFVFGLGVRVPLMVLMVWGFALFGLMLFRRLITLKHQEACAQRSLTNPVGTEAAPCSYRETILGRGQGRAS